MALLSPIMWGVPENVDRGKPLNISTNVTWSLFSTFPPFYPLLLPLPPPVTDSPSSPAVGSWKIKVSWVAKQWGMLSLASVYHPSWCSIYKRAISTTHTCLSVLQDSHKIGKLFHLKSTASISPSPFRNDVSLWFIWRCVILNIYHSSSQHNSRPDLEDFDSSLVPPEDLFSAPQTGPAVWHTRWQASVKDKNIKHFLMISILW